MNDSDKPAPDTQKPSEARPENRPGIDRLRGSGATGKVPSLDEKDLGYGFGTKSELFDADLERDLERDLQEALGGADIKQLYAEGSRARAKPGQPEPGPRKGRVLSIRGKDVFVDVGGRIQGVMPLQQFGDEPPAIGSEIEVHIEGYDPDGLLILARQGAAVEADWSSVTAGMIVEARVTATNKGGLSVEVNGIRGFMPISQIEMFRIEDLNPYVNQRMLCLVTEVDRQERNLVVSRRALLEKERDEKRDKLWIEIAEGQIREGIVRSIKPFGAFVDLGGADGLLPVGELSWTRVKDPSEVVQPGQKVRVVVLRLDRDARKITLGLRQLSASPWDEANTNYPPGSTARGKVTKLMDFGAFVELEPGIEGLVHVSELAPQRINRVSDVVKVDQEVTVKVLNVDVPNRKMSLSIKAALNAPEPTAAEVDETEEETPAPPPRKPTVPLRGGLGTKVVLPMPPES
jgi:small subunit ribosomal protein S1